MELVSHPRHLPSLDEEGHTASSDSGLADADADAACEAAAPTADRVPAPLQPIDREWFGRLAGALTLTPWHPSD